MLDFQEIDFDFGADEISIPDIDSVITDNINNIDNTIDISTVNAEHIDLCQSDIDFGSYISGIDEIMIDNQPDAALTDIIGDNAFEAGDILDFSFDDTTADGVCAEDLGNFDPLESDPDDVIGNPAASMREWEYQGDTGRCSLYSQKFVIEELTGRELDIEKMADFAEKHGWFSEDSGTPLCHMDKILKCCGVHTEMTFHNSIADMERCFESGRKVIVSIDADEIWYGENDSIFTPFDGPNHAVEVIGIDYTNKETPMVILNDSGNPNGCGEMIPIDTFVDAWEDGNCQMISCA